MPLLRADAFGVCVATSSGHDGVMTAGYPLPTYHDSTLYPDGVPDDLDGSLGWTAQDYTLCVALGVADNYAAQDLVADALARRGDGLGERIRLDSEMGCFFAHADSEADIDALAELVADLVAAGPHPGAVPGPMAASPAFISVGELTVPESWG